MLFAHVSLFLLSCLFAFGFLFVFQNYCTKDHLELSGMQLYFGFIVTFHTNIKTFESQ